jgi:hydrogenase nickel incorporation protein HypA/HybF
MHELAIGRAILEAAIRHADGRRVTGVSVRAGALRQVVPATLAFYLELLARGTACEGATIELTRVPLRMRCPCGHAWEPGELSLRCPACDGGEAAIVAGEELELESIELLDAHPAASRRASASTSSTSPGSAAPTSGESPVPASNRAPSTP